MAVGVPVALLSGIAAPMGWLAGPVWIAGLGVAIAFDALRSGARDALFLDPADRTRAAVGRAGVVELSVRFEGSGRTPAWLEAAAAADPRLGLSGASHRTVVKDRKAGFRLDFCPERRGIASLDSLWVRWSGPLDLIYKQKTFELAVPVHVETDIQGVRDEAVRLFARDAMFGTKAQIQLGEGSEFHALSDYQPGMDRRAIDWKQSARHALLVAKEHRTERNHNVIMALDCGRVGCEPVGNMPRIDRFIHAALLVSYASLRSGDRAGLFSFDSEARIDTGALAGLNALRTLQAMAGRIDYSTRETNYTLALSTLAGRLKRRSLVVVFTEFSDTTTAELMVEALGRLLRRHLILFVVLRDDELESLVAEPPRLAEDVARAVVAASLIREREVVMTRLRRMGVHIVEAPADRIGPDVLNAYLELKRRDLL